MLIMQNYTDNVDGDTPLTAGNAWYFLFPLTSGTYMFDWKEKQNFCMISAGITSSKLTIGNGFNGFLKISRKNIGLQARMK